MTSDATIKQLADDIARQRGKKVNVSQFDRFSQILRHASSTYKHALVAPNTIRERVRKLNRAAALVIAPPDDYTQRPNSTTAREYRERLSNQTEKVFKLVERLDEVTRDVLARRFAARRNMHNVDLSTMLPIDLVADGPISPLPAAQAEYLSLVASLTLSGAYYETETDEDGETRLKPGRLRPNGERSRPSPELVLYAPPAEENPEWRKAERELETLLAAAWMELTGDEQPRQDANYVVFIEAFLAAVGTKHVNVAALVREANQKVQAGRQEAAARTSGHHTSLRR